jgi:heme/copper-type cytochrome/quinol oxidase subunit 4
MKLQVSTGWKVVLYAFAIILIVQGLDLSYYLMNQKDSYLANLGIVSLVAVAVGMGYCLVQMVTNMVVFIKEQIKKEG